MSRRSLLLTILTVLCLYSGRQGASFAQSTDAKSPLTDKQIRQMVREVAQKDQENDKAQRDYTYAERVEEKHLDGSGTVKNTEIRTYEIMVLYQEPVRKLIARDDKPLPAKEADKEEANIQKIIDKRKNESESDRSKRLQKEIKDREDARMFVTEIADAYNFRQVGEEEVEGHHTYVIDADPRPGFKPQRKEARMLPKFRFRAWVEKETKQWLKLDIQCIDTVSVGLFLLRVHQGSNIQIEQTQVNEEVWLPKHVALKVDARIALFKGLNVAEDVTYRDYRKFRTGTKIIPAEEAPEQR